MRKITEVGGSKTDVCQMFMMTQNFPILMPKWLRFSVSVAPAPTALKKAALFLMTGFWSMLYPILLPHPTELHLQSF